MGSIFSKHFFESIGERHIGLTSSITVAELSVGAHLSKQTSAIEKTLDILNIVEVVSIDQDVDIDGGKIYSDLVKNGKTIELNDCLIAATSLSMGISKIVTRNISNFERIEQVEVLIPEDPGFELLSFCSYSAIHKHYQ